jgi:hypothetical protein
MAVAQVNGILLIRVTHPSVEYLFLTLVQRLARRLLRGRFGLKQSRSIGRKRDHAHPDAE